MLSLLRLLRLSTNKLVMGGTPYATLQAWQIYQTVIDLPEISFISEPPSIEVAMQKLTRSPKSGTPGWTDAYLTAFASLASLRLVSFDKGFTQYGGLDLLTLKTS